MSLSISNKRDFIQSDEFIGTNIYKFGRLRKLMAGKLSCLILNPGSISAGLCSDSKFRDRFTVDYWDNEFGHELTNFLNEGTFDMHFHYSVILVDPSGKNQLTDRDLQLVNELRLSGKSVYSLTSFYEHITGKIPLVYLKDHWIVNNDLFFVNKLTKFHILKRIFDIVISLILLPFAACLVLPAALVTVLTSKGPFLFKQKRVGKNGRPFNIYKIRTMVHNPKGHSAHTVKNDSRITLIGGFLRKTKIDELPQLLNILIGEMSLIGPRPEKVDIVQEMVKQNPYYHLRHTIIPGVTGWAQVNNPTATPEESLEKLEYDLYYAKNMSLYLDFKIVLQTIKVVITMNSL